MKSSICWGRSELSAGGVDVVIDMGALFVN